MDLSPTLGTDRLQLRPFQLSDAPSVQRLASDHAVAKGTLVLPHPYPDGEAERWIAALHEGTATGTLLTLAIVLREPTVLIGSIGVELAPAHYHGRMSYWLGREYWNHGYGTEAVRAILAYGFHHLRLHRIYAPHFRTNPASGRLLQKVGMVYEGRLREQYRRDDEWIDVELYSLLDREFSPSPPGA